MKRKRKRQKKTKRGHGSDRDDDEDNDHDDEKNIKRIVEAKHGQNITKTRENRDDDILFDDGDKVKMMPN